VRGVGEPCDWADCCPTVMVTVTAVGRKLPKKATSHVAPAAQLNVRFPKLLTTVALQGPGGALMNSRTRPLSHPIRVQFPVGGMSMQPDAQMAAARASR
jgi:hypothetical protein